MTGEAPVTDSSSSPAVLFVSQVRDRSRENQAAFDLLWRQNLLSPAVALVRQELDNMVRVMFLLDAAPAERMRLIHDSLSGRHWTCSTSNGKTRKITDRDLIEHALVHHPWTQQVCRFGCNFIHLSNWHGHRGRDPVVTLRNDERADIESLIADEGLPSLSAFTFDELVQLAPYSMDKIGSNLGCYLRDLEQVLGLLPHMEDEDQ